VERQLTAVVSAWNEEDRIGATVAALREAFPRARIVVADDHSDDGTADAARAAGAEVVTAPRRLGKGGANNLAFERLRAGGGTRLVLLCDGDLGESARALAPLVEAVERGDGDLAVAVFARRVGGGFGVALGFASWAIRRRAGIEPRAPISGQRALRPEVVDAVLPFAPRFGMETAMTIDATRAGFKLVEVDLELEHRATGRTAAGFVHRFRQLTDIVRVYIARR
jgi:glycosyltransferase involved in cell wall biosynthesis